MTAILEPLVTIIVPAYNHEEFVASTLDSILNQSYNNIELIVINDGSIDSTGKIIERYAEKDHRIRYIDQINMGLTKTLNIALNLSQGSFITIIASDDEFVPDRIKSHVDVLLRNENTDFMGCYGDREVIDRLGQSIADTAHPSYDHNNFLIALIKHSCIFHLPATTFRAEAIKAIQFDESLHCEDYDFFIRFLNKHRLLYVPEITFKYRIHGSNMSGSNSRVGIMRMTDDYWKIYLKNRSLDGLKKYDSLFRASICRVNAEKLYSADAYWAAFRWLLRSWQAMPSAFFKTYPLLLKIILGSRVRKIYRLLNCKL